ncbi:MAG: cupin domain-containing protein [Pleurocapsa sp.]
MLINPDNVPETKSTNYPEPFKRLVAGRSKKRLGDAAGLTNFGVNLVKLEPGSWSSIRHWHLLQDEFIYIIQGEVTLVTNAGEQLLKSGNMVGFPAGEADGHHIINRSDSLVIYLEIGDRTAGDEVTYPDADLLAHNSSGTWIFTRKDGSNKDIEH